MSKYHCPNKITKGFSLIEIMIVIVIIGILASIAIPSYQNYIQRGNRSQAQSGLLQLAAAMEQFHARNDSYSDAIVGSDPSVQNTVFSNRFPITGNQLYTLSIEAQAQDTYTLQAVPAGTNTDTAQFRLSSTGLKQSKNSNSGNWNDGWDTQGS